MEDMRSKSYNGNVMQIQAYNNNNHPNLQDLRCYSTSHASSSSSYQQSQSQSQSQSQMDNNNNNNNNKNPRFKKSMSSRNGSNWSFNDPELQRKKRVATYKAYTVEGKVKGSIKKSFRWIKDKYSQMVYGLRS